LNPRRHLATAPQPILFSDRGCPFAHRVLALIEHLGIPADLREAAVGEMPEGLDEYTQSQRIPMLIHDDLILRESRIILEYLAEQFALDDAYPEDAKERALHRYAMAVADDTLAPLLMGRAPMPDDIASLEEALDVVERATGLAPARASLLALHLAPIWRAFQLWHPECVVVRAIRERPALQRWLDAAKNLECVSQTAASIETLKEDMERARRAGLLPETF
jgi:glutathione S-transferase